MVLSLIILHCHHKSLHSSYMYIAVCNSLPVIIVAAVESVVAPAGIAVHGHNNIVALRTVHFPASGPDSPHSNSLQHPPYLPIHNIVVAVGVAAGPLAHSHPL